MYGRINNNSNLLLYVALMQCTYLVWGYVMRPKLILPFSLSVIVLKPSIHVSLASYRKIYPTCISDVPHRQHYLTRINPHTPNRDLIAFWKITSKTRAKQNILLCQWYSGNPVFSAKWMSVSTFQIVSYIIRFLPFLYFPFTSSWEVSILR